MDDSRTCCMKEVRLKLHIVRFHLHKAQKQIKLTYALRSQGSGHSWGNSDWKGT